MSVELATSLFIGALGVLASILQGRKTSWGWALGFGSEVLWIASGIYYEQWGLTIAGLTYAGVALWNFRLWRRDEKHAPKPRRAVDKDTLR